MTQTRSNRRRLAFAGLAAVFFTCGTGAQACNFAGANSGRSANPAVSGPVEAEALKLEPAAAQPIFLPGAVQGLWQVNFISGGQTVDMAFEVFHIDGTEMLNDITPPAQGNVCLGVWVQTSSNGYSVTHPAWEFDSNGNLTGTSLTKLTISLTSLTKFTGSYSLATYDLKGNPGPVYTGTMTATRVQPGNSGPQGDLQ